MRLFVAIDLPDTVKNGLEPGLNSLKEALDGLKAQVKWVHPDQFHFTIKFLGHCGDDQVSPVKHAMAMASHGLAKFKVRLGGFGVFPEQGPLRILWVGVEAGSEPMADLALRLDLAFLPLGFRAEDRAFSAHVTLARVKSLRDASKARALIKDPRAGDSGEFEVNSIALYRSDLSSQGPTYTRLGHYSFDG